MTTFMALLRAVNVGGHGKLAMADVRAACASCGFRRAQTYIASGNVVFEADEEAAGAKAALEDALRALSGGAIGVCLRSAAEMAAVLAANPFADRPPNLVHVLFLDAPPPRDCLGRAAGRALEDLALGLREIYLFYPQGQGASKLRLAEAKAGTARNLNTVAMLCKLAAR